MRYEQAWTGEEDIGDALVSMLQRLPLASVVFTTLGAKGAVMLQRAPAEQGAGRLDPCMSCCFAVRLFAAHDP